jgi:dihydroorotate dehydrogenase
LELGGTLLIWLFFKRFLFSLDAERAHRFGVFFMSLLARVPFVLRKICSAQKLSVIHSQRKNLVTTAAGISFVHPVGLAAGFDKNGELLNAIESLGFSFVELGTVTPRAQLGNESPRLFRRVGDQALFNRMGFNNHGADKLAEKLKKFRKKNPQTLLRVGVNLGKNKDTLAELADRDYAMLAHRFAALADYLVVNVSSPNTPGLRDLQTVKSLEPIIKAVLAETRMQSVGGRSCPVFLKLAPELEGEALKDIFVAGDDWGLSGYVLTNTLAGEHRGLKGGWSGGPLRQKSLRALEYARHATDRPLISVGGILTETEAQDRLLAGASLLQIYTGWVYRGPRFPSSIVNSL